MTNFESLLNSDYEEYSRVHTIQESMNEANMEEQELIKAQEQYEQELLAAQEQYEEAKK